MVIEFKSVCVFISIVFMLSFFFTCQNFLCFQILKQTNQKLENRTQLVTHCHIGPKVFINCAGFIKIDTVMFSDS